MDEQPRHSPASRALWSRHRRGDRSAIGELSAQDHDWIERLAAKLLGDKLRAELESLDIVQMTLERVLTEAREDRLPPLTERASLKRFLAMRVNQTIRNAARERRAKKRGGSRRRTSDDVDAIPTDEHDPAEEAVRRDDRQRLQLALASLDESDRRLIDWKDRRGLTHGQIADRLGCEPGTARKRYERALGKLRKALERLRR